MATNDPNARAENDLTTKTTTTKHHPRLEAARSWWTQAWNEGGVLYSLWDDVREAPDAGWHGMANWLKAAVGMSAFSFVVFLFTGAVDVLTDAVGSLLTAVPTVKISDNTSTGVWATIDNPIRSYIAAHSADLPISGPTVYTLWRFTGLFCLVAGFFTRSNGVRLTWTAWGAASIAMVWTTTPDTSRTVAAGVALLAWTLASAFALRGLNLRPRVFNNVGAPQITVRPEIHVPAQPGPADTDNVRHLR